MKVKKIGVALIVVIWLFLMVVPFVSIMLATRGELSIGNESSSGLRLFLLDGTEQEGIGLQLRNRVGADNDCLKTSVYYYLWEGAAEDLNTSYCQCFDPQTGNEIHLRNCPS